MKLYVSRFANRELKTGKYDVYGICRSMPRYPTGYSITGDLIELAPGWNIFRENDKEKFEKGYRRQLDELGVDGVREILGRIRDTGRDVVLCCYEDIRNPEQFCHRTTFARWWHDMTGETIEELQDPSPNKWSKNEKKEERKEPEKKEPEFVQLSLFDII